MNLERALDAYELQDAAWHVPSGWCSKTFNFDSRLGSRGGSETVSLPRLQYTSG
ncbi:uncharacterized protein LACBIDRAFT_317656 [Laccaria bicolor S238N-H82]|uniref:Predicted protein n=1 Tax=Laccaria bicolor (strain S238N-H82 / ATCC MYA-4686) TaxID=486041 RepID=B0E251_LACBS|nr:uncharacterized protein LACBIDRAFT_317656 [Laccaria bicolor S238N-H82]EDQ99078.1 predicted protein [Laccaria bicolor S238N-H82]|eukprot:XP_001890280.1 predicted protein [Laccaria bicolor S238N-H82]